MLNRIIFSLFTVNKIVSCDSSQFQALRKSVNMIKFAIRNLMFTCSYFLQFDFIIESIFC